MARPTKADKLENVATRVTAETAKELMTISGEHDRPMSWLLRKFIQRGMAAFYRDGLFDEPGQVESERTPTVTNSGGLKKPVTREKLKEAFDVAHGREGQPAPNSDRQEMERVLIENGDIEIIEDEE